jgi:PAS domain S-box-containing protein
MALLQMNPYLIHPAFEAGDSVFWNWNISADRIAVDPLSSSLTDEASLRTFSHRDWLKTVHPEDRPAVERALSESLQNKSCFKQLFRVTGAGGAWRWIEVRAGVRTDRAGNPVEMSGVSVDITGQKNAELALARREAGISALIDALDAIVWEGDPQTCEFAFVSQQAERILGYPAEDWLQPGFWAAHIHPDDRVWCLDFCKQAFRDRRDHNFEYRMMARDGRVVWLQAFITLDSGLDGTPLSRGMMVDISARKESEALFDLLFDQSPAGLVVFDHAADKVRVNAAYCRFVGRSKQEVMSTPFTDKIHPDDRAMIPAMISELDQGRPVDKEMRFLRGDGEVVWGRMVAQRSSAGGRLRPGLSIVEDITAQKRAEAILRESHENFRTVANDTPALLWMTSPSGQNSYLNRAAAALLGVREDRFEGDLFQYVHPDDSPRSREIFAAALLNRAPCETESRIRRYDGEYRWLLHRYVPRFSESGEFLGHVVASVDITERKLAEEKLKDALDRLKAELRARSRLQRELSDLSERIINAQEEERRRVARELHDGMGNQIAALTIAVSSLSRKSDSAETRMLAKILENMAQTIRDLSHQLHPVLLEFAGLAPALRELCTEFTELTGIRVTVTAPEDLGSTPPEVGLCAYRVTQEALQNIAKHSGAKTATVSLARDGKHLVLTVRDPGVGFDAAKRRQHGGLGLVSIRERVRLLKGTLAIESSPGEGTTLRVSVPSETPGGD